MSARVPLVTRKRLEVIQAQRGDVFLSETVGVAIDEFITTPRAKGGSVNAAAQRDRALEIVGENAGTWLDRAVEAIRRVARRNATLTTAQVWATGLDNPHNPKAMGAAIVKAKAAGIIAPSGLPPVSTERANARKLTVWKSLLWRPSNGWEAGNRERKAGRIARRFMAACGDRPVREIAAAAHRLPLDWWRAFAVEVAKEERTPSDATILLVLDILDEGRAAA